MAYENMLIFEKERQREKHERQMILEQAGTSKLRNKVVNYQTAQLVREKERDLQQAKFFHNQLAVLVAKEEKKSKDSLLQGNLHRIGSQIDNMEQKEVMMLENL